MSNNIKFYFTFYDIQFLKKNLSYIAVVLFNIMVSNSVCGQGLPSFLVGNWKIENKPTYEQWWQINNNLMYGQSYTFKDSIKVISEILEIRRAKHSIIYTATVLNQNEGLPISFVLNNTTDSIFSFENELHNFPKKIQYHTTKDSRIKVHVIGENDRGFSINLIKQEPEKKIPYWYKTHINDMVGTWVADNSNYKSETEKFDAFVIEWKYGIGQTNITAQMYALTGGEKSDNFWEFREYWDNESYTAKVIQYGNWGMIGEGVMIQMAENKFETIQSFSLPDGKKWVEKHKINLLPTQQTTISFDYMNTGRWEKKRTYLWHKE